MYVSRYLYCHVIILLCLWRKCDAFCGQHIQFKQFDIDSVFGMWYGVGYAQHIPDLTNKPGEIGCVTLHVSDVTNEVHDDWLGWENPTYRQNCTNPKWESPNNNPWSANPMSGSWLDYRMRLRSKREVPFLSDRRLRVVWDEDGQTEEQVYVFSTMSPGLWKLEQLRPGEQERSSRKLDIWYPDYSTKPPEYIYVLQSTPNSMVLYHCTEGGGTRTFSLVLRRFPARMASWDWYHLRKVLFGFELPHVYRYSAVCAGCVEASSGLSIMVCVVILSILNKVSVCV